MKRDARGRFVSPPEPVFTEHEPVFGDEHEARMQPYRWVPYPYQFHWDGGWLFVLFLTAGGFAFRPLFLLAGFIALLRVVVWCSFRFPLTTVFLTATFIDDGISFPPLAV